MAFALTLAGAALACGLEMLEAMAIVLAVALERRPRDAVLGGVGAVAACAVVALALGPALTEHVGLRPLRLVVGAGLLWFGSTWLRKGVLRLAGRKRRSSSWRDFEEERAELHEVPTGADWTARSIAFKGVFLEGVEVVLIVSALGARSSTRAPALLGMGLAAVLVVVLGALLHRPLRRAPETELKFMVGVMLVTFGTFYFGEGLGIEWPLDDLALLWLALSWFAVACGCIAILRRNPEIARRSV
jgi:uncharacterized membrane protein